jgi:hypothetical protein
MWRVFKENWKLIITGLIIIPIVADLIVFCPAPFPCLVVESTKEWLNFFAAYISALIGAFVSFVILYKTIEHNKAESLANRQDNHTENEINRNLQISILKYQIAKEGLNAVKTSLANYKQSLNIMDLSYFPYSSNTINEQQINLRLIKNILAESDSSYNLLMINLTEYKDEYEMQFKAKVQYFGLAYEALLKDLAWFIDNPESSVTTNHLTIENIIKSTQKYKEYEESQPTFIKDARRIWDIIEKYEFQIYANRSKIMDDLLDSFDFKAFDKLTEEFMTYERDKNEFILTTKA